MALALALKMKIEIVGTSDLYLVRFVSLNLFNWCSKEEMKRKWLRGEKMFIVQIFGLTRGKCLDRVEARYL